MIDQETKTVVKTWLVLDTTKQYRGKRNAFILEKALNKSAVGTNHSNISTSSRIGDFRGDRKSRVFQHNLI